MEVQREGLRDDEERRKRADVSRQERAAVSFSARLTEERNYVLDFSLEGLAFKVWTIEAVKFICVYSMIKIFMNTKKVLEKCVLKMLSFEKKILLWYLINKMITILNLVCFGWFCLTSLQKQMNLT